MTAASSVRTTQSHRIEPSLAKSTTHDDIGTTRPISRDSDQFHQDVYPDEVPNPIPPKDPVVGWPTVAKMMASTPEFGNLCRFSDLNMTSLLYYQVELFHLRKELHKHEWNDYRDAKRGTPYSEFFSRADKLIASKDLDKHEQWDVVVKIRKVLKEYNKALLQYTELSKKPSPHPYNTESFRRWLAAQTCIDPENDRIGENNIDGDGEECIWGDIYKDNPETKSLLLRFPLLFWHLISPVQVKDQYRDMIATSPKREVDRLTRWVMTDFVPFYDDLTTLFRAWFSRTVHRNSADDAERGSSSHGIDPPSPTKSERTAVNFEDVEKPIGKKKDHDEPKPFKPDTITKYSGKAILRFTSAVATVVACLLPTVAIAVLSKIHDTGSRLGAIAGLTALFAAGLMILTDAGTSRVEIFTATAAFSAVMVVFVQNT